MVVAALGLVIAALPVFLVGGIAVQIRADLGFSETMLGAVITAFFVAVTLASIPGGRLSDRIGARRALIAGTSVTAVALGIVAVAQSWVGIAVGLAVAGLALGITEPGIALVVARLVPGGRQGLAFGIKEAAVPGSTLLAGVAVPSIALTVGWRWAFGAAALLVPVMWLIVPRDGERRYTRDTAGLLEESSKPPAMPLSIVAAGAGLGVAAVTAMSAFLVEAAVAAGLAPGRAGLLLSAGSVAGVVGRVAVGWLADRTARPQLPVVALMLTGGAGALGLLALAGSPDAQRTAMLLVIGTVLAFSVGWGWTGLLFLSAVRSAPDAPAGAAGIALAGLSVGGAGGPLLFGYLVSTASFPAAWTAGSAMMVSGAGLIVVGNRLLARRVAVSGQR